LATIFVTGSDTGVGKTRVAGWIARSLAASGSVQVIKPVESGAASDRPADAPTAAGHWASAHTLVSLPLPLAPLAAAAAAGVSLSLDDLLDRLAALPAADHRVIEGAGGIAVPIDPDGRDWADFAAAIHPDLVVLVVEDRLGAINQARLASDYLLARLPKGKVAIWLNAAGKPCEVSVARANREGIAASGLRLAGESDFGDSQPRTLNLS
jgi:dethiobiotin synthetase